MGQRGQRAALGVAIALAAPFAGGCNLVLGITDVSGDNYRAEVIATGQTGIGRIALAEKDIFWTADAGVMKAPKSGGSVEKFQAATAAKDVALDSSAVYFIDALDEVNGLVKRVDLDGSNPIVVASGQPDLYRMALTDDHVVWASQFEGPIRTSLKSDVETYADLAPGPPFSLSGAETYAFWTSFSPPSVFSGLDDGCCGSVTLAKNQETPGGLVATFGSVYWVSGGLSIMTVDSAGSSPVRTVVTDNQGMLELALDDEAIYWTNMRGEVKKAFVNVGEATTLVTDEGGPASIAVDDAYVYWAGTDGTVKRVPK